MMADVSDVSGIAESRFNGSEDDVIDVSIFAAIKQIRNNNNRADVPAIFSVMTKGKEFENLTPNFIDMKTFFIFGDFNTEPSEDFCLNYNLSNLIKEPTCFKNHENPSCIDLILTNFPRHFQNSMAVETGLSDCHKMIVTVMKSQYEKLKPKLISYRKYNNFSNDIFRVMVIEKMQGWKCKI